MKANKAIREAVKSTGVFQWQIAQALGITDSTFTRWLRTELPQEKKVQIMGIIENLTKEEL